MKAKPKPRLVELTGWGPLDGARQEVWGPDLVLPVMDEGHRRRALADSLAGREHPVLCTLCQPRRLRFVPTGRTHEGVEVWELDRKASFGDLEARA